MIVYLVGAGRRPRRAPGSGTGSAPDCRSWSTPRSDPASPPVDDDRKKTKNSVKLAPCQGSGIGKKVADHNVDAGRELAQLFLHGLAADGQHRAHLGRRQMSLEAVQLAQRLLGQLSRRLQQQTRKLGTLLGTTRSPVRRTEEDLRKPFSNSAQLGTMPE